LRFISSRSSSWFQFLGRNSGRSDSYQYVPKCQRRHGFNSSVGILVVRTTSPATKRAEGCVFQFLGRNSGRSDVETLRRWLHITKVSIPRSEFWSFGRCPKMGGTSSGSVSIPRSEFWSFGLRRSGEPRGAGWCFNSSVGILVVRTRGPFGPRRRTAGFQFLGRNSGRSDNASPLVCYRRRHQFQFLGRNSGRSDVTRVSVIGFHRPVSIPRSEFWSFGPRASGRSRQV